MVSGLFAWSTVNERYVTITLVLMWYMHISLSSSPPPSLHLLSGEIDNPFCAVDMMERLRNDPKTKDFLNDPQFSRKLEELSKDPDKLIK